MLNHAQLGTIARRARLSRHNSHALRVHLQTTRDAPISPTAPSVQQASTAMELGGRCQTGTAVKGGSVQGALIDQSRSF